MACRRCRSRWGMRLGVHEPAGEMYGKVMSISDELMWRYWTLLTDLRVSEIAAMQEQVRDGALHPMQAKKNLAWTITKGFHSAGRGGCCGGELGEDVSAARGE